MSVRKKESLSAYGALLTASLAAVWEVSKVEILIDWALMDCVNMGLAGKEDWAVAPITQAFDVSASKAQTFLAIIVARILILLVLVRQLLVGVLRLEECGMPCCERAFFSFLPFFAAFLPGMMIIPNIFDVLR